MANFSGKLLYELADSVMRFHNSNYQHGKLETITFINELKSCSEMLKESINCLRLENEGTFEMHICFAAENLLNETNSFISYMEEK